MSIRAAISNYPAISLALAAAAILTALIYVAHALHRGAAASAPVGGQAFFTTDDGATLFADDIGKLPPFDHDGREAVRAMVFTCDGGQHHWVQYLQKFTDDAKQQLPGAGNSQAAAVTNLHARATGDGLLVKAPGAATWYPQSDVAHCQEICLPKPPPAMGDGPAQLMQP